MGLIQSVVRLKCDSSWQPLHIWHVYMHSPHIDLNIPIADYLYWLYNPSRYEPRLDRETADYSDLVDFFHREYLCDAEINLKIFCFGKYLHCPMF